jgi:hypothetical protein
MNSKVADINLRWWWCRHIVYFLAYANTEDSNYLYTLSSKTAITSNIHFHPAE